MFLMTPTDNLNSQKSPLRILHVEDNGLDAEFVARSLRQGGLSISVAVVQTEKEFERELRSHPPDIVLVDYNLPQWKGMDALAVLRREKLDIPLILVSGALRDVTAVECLKRGATDYVLKDGLARLPEAVRRALHERDLLQLQRQTEQDLAQNLEELARSKAELEQIADVISHDLQEPLQTVTTNTQLLAENYRGRLDENADKLILDACEGAHRMQTLIQDVISRLPVSPKREVCEPVDCNAVLDEILQTISPSLEQSGGAITHGTLPVLPGDRSQLLQVFQNLIGTALQSRGKESPVISVQAERSGDQWEFSVSDNSTGITTEHAKDIFVAFPPTDTQSEYPGNDFAVCKTIIEHCGGRIWIEPQPDQGSTFKFTLPCEGPPTLASSSSEERKATAQHA
jgi:signal transduction histidine kinase